MNEESPTISSNWKTKIKENKTPLLIALLAVLTVCLVLIAVSPKKSSLTPPPASEEQVIDPAQSVLTMQSASTSTGSIQTVDVNIDTGENKVTGVQLELTYDPKLISNVTLTPGSFISSPVELLKQVDTTNGTITYVLGIQIGSEGVAGTGTVAKISYNEVGPAGQTASIKFLPKSVVSAEGFSGTALRETTDFSKVIGQSATPSAQ